MPASIDGALDSPILYRSEVQTSDQEEAVIEAMDRIDGVLRH